MPSFGENKWASVIAGVRNSPISAWNDGVKLVLFVQVGKWIKVAYPLNSDFSDFFDYRDLRIPSRMKPNITLSLTHSFFGSARAETQTFPISEGYFLLPFHGEFNLRISLSGAFLSIPSPITPGIRSRVRLSGPHPSLPRRPVRNISPQKLVNISRQVTASRRRATSQKRARSLRQFGPYARSSHKRPNLEIFNISYVGAIENPSYFENSTSYEAYRRAYTGVTTPGFRSKRRGSLPVNGYSLSRVVHTTPNSFDIRKFLNGAIASAAYNSTFTIFDPEQPAPQHDSRAEDKCIAKIIKRAEVELDGNLAQDLVQFGQTTKLIAKTAITLAASMSALRHGRLSEASRILLHGGNVHEVHVQTMGPVSKSVANHWLGMQYGWKPLLQDIDGSMRSLANAISRDSTRRSVSASASVRSGSQRDLFHPALQPSTPIGRRETINETTCRMGFVFKIDSKVISFLAQTGFTNPLNLAWEVLPYSFVVDWFLPIGPYLSALSAWDGMSFVEGFKTTFTRETVFGRAYSSYTNPVGVNNGIYVAGGSYERKYLLHDRVRLLAFPKQRFPRFKNPLSETHVYNALALLRSAWR